MAKNTRRKLTMADKIFYFVIFSMKPMYLCLCNCKIGKTKGLVRMNNCEFGKKNFEKETDAMS